MSNAPFVALKYLHNNFSCFTSNNDNKYDILDANRVPYIAKYNKEIAAQKSCIYDLEWLNSNQIACGGGDQFVSIYDTSTSQRLAVLKGHTESVKSITSIPQNPFVIASGSRDGSILIFDIRCNKFQASAEIAAELNIETDTCCIRSMNNFQKAHFTENTTAHNSTTRSILKSKPSNLNTTHLNSNLKKSTPVSCVLFQNDHLLVSSGVTDGLIKVWDTRKIYTCTAKKSQEPIPLYIFDNGSNHAKKGYTHLTFNSTKTHLYTNCMNNSLYELNFLTYNPNHSRVVNQPLNSKKTKNFHLNNSNFIKSSLSQCDNFIVTGSSDFNAYIYSTNINSNLACFRQQMPVIVLKGHTNEVTTVDWNPFDSNQLVTCSDDNTIRLWNIKRELQALETSECNFLKAETIDEFSKDPQATLSDNEESENIDQENLRLNENYISCLPFRQRIFTKYRPHTTGVYDDFYLIGYEYNKLMRRPKTIKNNIDFEEMDFEAELCLKCENINIDKVCTDSPNSSMLNSIENQLVNQDEMDMSENNRKFIKLNSFLSNLPINLLEEETAKETFIVQESKILNTNNTLLSSVFSTLSQAQTKPKPKVIKRKVVKQKKSPDSSPPENALSQFTNKLNLTKTPLTGKKRNLNSTIKEEMELNGNKNDLNIEQPKTPRSKKRLIMSEGVSAQPSTPSTSRAVTSTGTGAGTPRTILDYFSAKNQSNR